MRAQSTNSADIPPLEAVNFKQNSSIKSAILLYNNTKRLLINTTILYLIVLCPVLLANRTVLDDLYFSTNGNYYKGIGRPLGEIFNPLLNLGAHGVNAALANQLIAIGFLSASGALLAARAGIRSKLLASISVLPLGAHPYFLENISYGFDAHGMAAGVFFSAVAACLAASTLSCVYVLAAGALVFATLAIYPSDVNVYFCLVGFFILQNLLTPKQSSWTMLLRSMLAGVSGVAIYALVVHGYVQSNFPAATLVSAMQVLTNFQTYWRTVWSDWSANFVGAILLANIACGTLALILRVNHRKPLASDAIFAAGIFLIIAFQQGMVLLLDYPWPIPRSYVSFGTILTALSLQSVAYYETNSRGMLPRLLLVPVFLSAYCVFVISSAAGAAMAAQKDYEASLVSRIIDDLEELGGKHKISAFTIIGKAPTSPVTRNTARKFPAIGRVVGAPINGDWLWGRVLFGYHGLNLPGVESDLAKAEKERKVPHVSLNRLTYRIVVVGEIATIVFPPADF